MDNRKLQANAAASPPNPPASPSVGYPTNGNPANSIPSTVPGDYWFYQMSEEIRNVIINAGLTPDIDDLTQLSAAILKLGVPVASIVAMTTTRVPSGFIECNGAAISRSTYNNLFRAISTTFGAGDGSKTFNLPDLRGEFIRGFDNGRGVDAGRDFGSQQADSLRAHRHFILSAVYDFSTISGSDVTATNQVRYASRGNGRDWAYFTHATNVDATVGRSSETGGAETRPRNIALMYCIKY